jgi:hypothetical protein
MERGILLQPYTVPNLFACQQWLMYKRFLRHTAKKGHNLQLLLYCTARSSPRKSGNLVIYAAGLMWLCKLLQVFCKKVYVLIHITEEARPKAGSNRLRDRLSKETKGNVRTYNYLYYMMEIYLILVLLSL